MGSQHQAMIEDSIAVGKTHANAKNIVRLCYSHQTGKCAISSDRRYLDWCEAKAHRWLEMADAMGYTGWTNEIRTLTGSITYHEWLKKEVGL